MKACLMSTPLPTSKMKFLKPMELYHESLKTRGPLMGLFIGDKHVGLSMSDASKEALDHKMIRRSKKQSVPSLRSLISRYSVSGLVIGCPLEKEERFPTAGVQARRSVDDLVNTRVQAKHFVDDLVKAGNIEDMNYTFWDDGSTSKALFNAIKEVLKPVEYVLWFPKLITDEYAAYEILKDYLCAVKQNEDQTLSPGQRKMKDIQ